MKTPIECLCYLDKYLNRIAVEFRNEENNIIAECHAFRIKYDLEKIRPADFRELFYSLNIYKPESHQGENWFGCGRVVLSLEKVDIYVSALIEISVSEGDEYYSIIDRGFHIPLLIFYEPQTITQIVEEKRIITI